MGIARALLKMHVGALLFFAGYSFCNYVHSDKRYCLTRLNNVPYRADKARKERLPIIEDKFQVGSLEYRLSGILIDQDLQQTLKKLKYGGEPR